MKALVLNALGRGFDFEDVQLAELYLRGRMSLDDLVSRTISLRDVNDGYAALKDGSLIRVVVTSF